MSKIKSYQYLILSHVGLAMPGDAEDSVAEASGDVGEVHGVHALVQNQLSQVLQDLVDVGVALRVAQEAPGVFGQGHLVLRIILDVKADKALASGGKTREKSDLANHYRETEASVSRYHEYITVSLLFSKSYLSL